MRLLCSAALTLAVAAGFVVSVSPSIAPVPAEAAGVDESTYTPLTPVRVLDTRAGQTPVGPGRTVSVDLTSRLPAGTTAVVLNLTGVSPTLATFVTAYPTGEARPVASNLNLAKGEIRANLATVRVTGTRSVTLYNNSGNTHLVADLAGYYSTNGGSRFTPTPDTPRRSTTLRPGETAPFDLSDSVPESATAVVLNVTGVAPTRATFLTVWPTGAARPGVSSVNLAAGKINPNLVTVAIGANRQVSVYNNAGDITVHADLAGFYTPEYGAVFAPRSPARVFDSRTGVGQRNGVPAPLRAGQPAEFLPGQGIPNTAIAAVTNLTGVAPTANTFMTASLGLGRPAYSQLNLVTGQISANLAVVPLAWRAPDARAYFYNNSGTANLVADLAGYFWIPTGGCVSDCAYSWGYNYGELGIGTTTSEWGTPTQVVGLSGVVQVAERYALRADGTVWAWGANSHGQLGNGWTGSRSAAPVPVRDLTGVVAVAATATTGFALRADGTVWGWGDATDGRLGTGDEIARSTPVRVPGLEDVTAIAGGLRTGYALRADGTVLAWGDNTSGEYGNGTRTPSPTPVPVSGLSRVTSIAASMFSAFAVMADGTVRGWGANQDGQLGNGSNQDLVLTPVEVPGATGVTKVATDVYRVFALRSDGTVLAWGNNYLGGLGNGVDCQEFETCVTRTPTPIALTGVVDVSGNGVGGYALDDTGRVWAWGANYSGELGHERFSEHAFRPVQVPNLPAVDSLGFSRGGGRVLVDTP